MPLRKLVPTKDKVVAFSGCQILDTDLETLSVPSTILVRGGRIEDITTGTNTSAAAEKIDVSGLVAVPGLIDSHVHVTQSGSHSDILGWDPSYHAARTSIELEKMLLRGFTTARDMGGAETGLAQALRESLLTGPRVFAGGPIFSPTGGHALTKVVDGEDDIRRALRAQFRDGADHIKLTASGGVISKMRYDALGFSENELRAAVDEANMAHRYVGAHVYTAEAVNRALRCGVRTIEHGTHLDDESLRLLVQMEDRFLVPTLAALWGMLKGKSRGTIRDDQAELVQDLLDEGLDSLRRATEAGVSIGYGTDLHGAGADLQLEEIRLRATVQRPEDILRSLTITGARIVNAEDYLGRLEPGYAADALFLDSDPRSDLEALCDVERHRITLTAGDMVS